MLGVVDDMWFQWVTDFGLPGPDRGEGGKYLFVPPGYKGELPGSGYFVQKMRTTRATMFGRAFLENNDPKPPVGLIKKTLKIYPYLPGGYGRSIGSALQGKATLARTPDHKLDWEFLRPKEPVKFIEGTGKVLNTVPPNDFSYFELINDLVQKEPAEALDPEIMGSLAAIGIVKSKPFQPDARMKKILTDAAAIGTASARTLDWRPRPAEGFYPLLPRWVQTLVTFGGEFYYRNQCVVMSWPGRSWRTRWVKQNSRLFGSISTAGSSSNSTAPGSPPMAACSPIGSSTTSSGWAASPAGC